MDERIEKGAKVDVTAWDVKDSDVPGPGNGGVVVDMEKGDL